MCALAVGGMACAAGGKSEQKPTPAAPVITSFVATPASVEPGMATTLIAVFANGTGEITPGIGAVTSGVPVGTDPLTATTTFTLTVTGAGGVRVTRSAIVTVVPAAGPGTVTVLWRGPTGALDPVAGLELHRSDAATGAVVETRVTDADGVADFGDVGASHWTLSFVRAGPGAAKTVVSFVGIPVGAVTLRLDRLPGPPDLLAEVHATLTPGCYARVLLPGGAFEPSAIPIARQHLQSDGRVTMLVQSGGGENGPMKCGVSLDQPVPAAGAEVPISVTAEPNLVEVTGEVEVSYEARRKDATFRVESEWTGVSGWLGSCFDLLPDVDAFAVTARGWVESVGTNEGWARANTDKWRTTSTVGPTPVTTVSFTMPDLVADGLSYGSGSFEVTAVGTLAGSVDLATARVVTPHLAWHVYAPGADALSLPEVPGVSPPAWGDGVVVEAELTVVDGVAGFDALWNEARRLGSFDAALMAHSERSSAVSQKTRHTPRYTVVFEGYTSGRYGLVTGDGGVDCGKACSGYYYAGTIATFRAIPNPGAVFRGWGGQCAGWGTTSPIQVLVDRYYACEPRFGPASAHRYSLTVSVGGAWPALIVSDDGSIRCGDDTLGNHYDQCWTEKDSGYGLMLTATPGMLGTVFDAVWHGSCSGTEWSVYPILDGDRSCSVELTPHPL